jgi:predicted AAA+ superfamily ATPase
VWIKREILANTIKKRSADHPIVVLTGSRQAGKTSLLRRAFPDHAYVSLDLPLLAEEAEQDGTGFLARHGEPLIVDEVQHAPGLLPYLKLAVDEARHNCGRFVLTGSQKFASMKGVTESLAGRVALLECHSLPAEDLEEQLGDRGEGDELARWMWLGGYPEVHARQLDPIRFYADYLATYLERDVRQLLGVRSLRDFNRFLRLAASRSGQLFNASAMAADIGISPNTAKAWLSVLEASGVVYLLPPFYRNIGKRLVKTPKLYFLDTGLAAFLVGLRSPEALLGSSMLGAMFETWFIGQVVRWHANRGLPADLYFYRDHYGHEVDLVIPWGEKMKLFECKWTAPAARVVKGFDEIVRLLGEENVVSRTLVTSARGYRKLSHHGISLDDTVSLASLGSG